MSYTQHCAIATCSIKNVLDVNDLCSHLYDYLTNHEDEIPEGLQDCSTFEEFADQVSNYVELTEDKLTMTMDTEEINSDNEIFDFITDHYAHLMTSKFMKIVWMSYDSRAGISADCTYYDNNNELINVEAILNAR
jgi:hypothetical protein